MWKRRRSSIPVLTWKGSDRLQVYPVRMCSFLHPSTCRRPPVPSVTLRQEPRRLSSNVCLRPKTMSTICQQPRLNYCLQTAWQCSRCKRPGLIPGWEDPLEEGMATHSSILCWRIPWPEEPGGLQFIGCQWVGHSWSNLACMHKELFPYWTRSL